MKKPTKSLLLSVLLLITALGLSYMWPFNKQPKITETKTFSCPGMEGFTFEYPVFEGWKLGTPVKSEGVDKIWCSIDFPLGDYQPGKGESAIWSGIQVEQNSGDFSLNKDELKINQNKLEYLSQKDSVSFLVGDSMVTISVLGGKNFPRGLFFQTVINSFRVA